MGKCCRVSQPSSYRSHRLRAVEKVSSGVDSNGFFVRMVVYLAAKCVPRVKEDNEGNCTGGGVLTLGYDEAVLEPLCALSQLAVKLSRPMTHYASSLTPSPPAGPNCCCSKGSAPYWSNPQFLIFDIWGPLAPSLERQSTRMSKIKNGGLDQCGKV